MSNIKLDLAGFRHVSSDDASTTLKHDKMGHTVTLAHNVLSPANREVLKALSKSQTPVKQDFGKVIHKKAEGGSVASQPVQMYEIGGKVQTQGRDKSAEADKQRTAREAGNASRGEQNTQASKLVDYVTDPSKIVSTFSNSWAQGGKIPRQRYEEGGQVNRNPSLGELIADVHRNLEEKPLPPPSGGPTPQAAPEAPQAEQPGIMSDVQGKTANAVESAENTPPANPNFNSVTGQTGGQPPQEQSEAQPETQAEAPQQAMPARSMPQATRPQAMPANTGQLQEAKPAEVTLDNLPQHLAEKYRQENTAFWHDLNNGHITPKTYSQLFHFNDNGTEKSTLGKIGMAFGLLMSGMGSGITGQPNAVLQMMDNTIKNDLEAQGKSKENAMNLLRINQARVLQEYQIPNLVAEGKVNKAQAAMLTQEANMKAYTMSRMQANMIAVKDMASKLSKLQPGSPEYQRAAQAYTMVLQGVNELNADLAAKASIASAAMGKSIQGAGQNSEEEFKQHTQGLRWMGKEDIARDLESKHITGEPQAANRPVEARDRDVMKGHEQLEGGLKDLYDNIDKLSTMPLTKDRVKMVEKIAHLQSKIRESALGTVYREGEQPLLDKILKTPASTFDKYITKAQLEELRKINRRDNDSLKKNYGIEPKPEAHPLEGKTATDVNGRKIIMKNGKWTPLQP